ncbi:hypothetical protein VTK56DRAFT_4973 [Thermocarpiscus australiensis]
MEQNRPKILHIVSHDRHTEMSPAMDLDYDLREVPNPPKALRRVHTGLSSGLREHLLDNPRFRALLDRAESEIRAAMGRAASAREELDSDQREQQQEPIVLRVGCMCGSGHHRSVAFAELLAEAEWPEDWTVELMHRDLTRSVKQQKARARRKRAASR